MHRNLKFFYTCYVCDVKNISSYVQFMLFCCKMDFVAICTLLSQNLFFCHLHTFVWKEIEPKIASVEKKYQVWVWWQQASLLAKGKRGRHVSCLEQTLITTLALHHLPTKSRRPGKPKSGREESVKVELCAKLRSVTDSQSTIGAK